MRATRSLVSLTLVATLSVAAAATASAAAPPPAGTDRYCPESDTYQVGACDSAAVLPPTPVGAQLPVA